MAITKVPFKKTYGLGEVEVTIINPKNNKKIDVYLELDTGAPWSAMLAKSARTLDIDLESGRKQTGRDFYFHQMYLKVGNLRPILTWIRVPSAKTNITFNVIGMNTLRAFKRVEWTDKYALFELDDTTTTTNNAKANAALAQAYTTFYGYPRWHTKRI